MFKYQVIFFFHTFFLKEILVHFDVVLSYDNFVRLFFYFLLIVLSMKLTSTCDTITELDILMPK